MVAIEVTRLDPACIVTSPTNVRGAVDHLIRRDLVLITLECKGVDARGSIPIRLAQLWDYVYGPGPRETTYLLPSRPPGTRPWVRRCLESCCNRVGCRFCPRDERSWAGLEPWITSLPPDDRLQPWFAHWSWCVQATALASHFALTPGAPRPAGSRALPWDDSALSALPAAARLCHFFGTAGRGRGASNAMLAATDQQVDVESLSLDPSSGEETPPVLVLQPTRG